MKKQTLGKTFGLVAILTILSKVAGLLRDIVVLQAFGTSIIADAYNYAYVLTGNVLVLFGGLGGPFHSSSVAILTPRKDDPQLGKLTGQLLLFTSIVLLLLSIAAYFLAPYIVPLIAPATGHLDSYKHLFWNETIELLRIMLPLIVVTGIVGISYGILNVYGLFFWPSLSPAIASIAIILGVLGFANTAAGLALAWGTTAGAIGQMLAQIPGMIKLNLKWGVPLKPQPGLSTYFHMLWPATISTSIGQLTVYIDMFFTSQLHEGSWTAIINANRLIQLPLGVLLTAMLVPILPRFTEQVTAGKINDLKEELRRALRFLWFLALPVSTLLIAIPGPIIQLLFQRGHFNDASRILVTTALLFLIPSIFFYVARDLITRVFYAHQDSNTPYRVAMLAIFVKALLDWILVGPLGIGGISLATTLITIFNLSLLTYFLKAKIGFLGLTRLIRPVALMLTSSIVAGLITYFSQHAIFTAVHFRPFISLALSVGLSGLFGLLVYVAICMLFKLEEPLLLLKRIRTTST